MATDSMQTLGDYVCEILRIVGHSDAEVREYERTALLTILQVATVFLLAPLSQQERDRHATILGTMTRTSDYLLQLTKEFGTEPVGTAIEQAAHDVMEEYISSIASTLREDQKQRLLHLADDMQAAFT